ncbi:uncharacterized protein LOC118204849, partial [Stegodyphus dumicola]|uniref:uncharacterized protein LOC118204849 n=1 Tax=Stegodyphus dumicola TaxID=202533 RepID=UPI0015AF52F6
MLHEEDNEDGTLLASLLSSQSIRVSHLGVQSGPGFLKTVERYFEKWNMVDLSDEGRILVSLAGGQHVDRLLRKLVQTSMHNKRTKLLVMDDPEKWQERLLSVKAYEVDLVIVSNDPLTITDCPTAIELLPSGSHSHKTEGKCKKLASSDRNLGNSIIADIRKNLTSCCSQGTENDYTFWKSSLSENGTQRLKAVAVWSPDLGILRMENIDVEMITLRVAIMQ